MARKEKINFQLLVDPDDPETLLLKPIDTELISGSVYTVNIKELEFIDGSIFSNKEEFITEPDNYMFVSVEDIKDHLGNLDISDTSILNHIIDASKTAMYWAKINVDANTELPDFNSETFQEDYYPFYMFIKHTAMAECIKEYYIELISGPKKWKDTLSDLGREEEMDFNALKRLMDDLEHEADEWLELVVTITADPKWALRGKYSYAVYNTYCKPYHAISWYKNDYSRGF
jgi:hypothetical protein